MRFRITQGILISVSQKQEAKGFIFVPRSKLTEYKNNKLPRGRAPGYSASRITKKATNTVQDKHYNKLPKGKAMRYSGG